MVWLVKNTSTILFEARTLVEQGWCQNALARNRAGAPVPTGSCHAASFCMMGALIAAGAPMRAGEESDPERYLRSQLGHEEIETINDRADWTRERALEAFDAAIKLAIENDE